MNTQPTTPQAGPKETPALSSAVEKPLITYIEKARVIEQSLRTVNFIFTGAGLEWRLCRAVLKETGEVWNRRWMWWLMGGSLICMPFLCVSIGWEGAFALYFLVMLEIGYRFYRQYRHGSYQKWNPARAYVFWTLFFDYASGYLMVTALTAVISLAPGPGVGLRQFLLF